MVYPLAVGHVQHTLQFVRRNHAFAFRPCAARPPENADGAVQLHGRSSEDQQIPAVRAKVADPEAAKLQEMLSVGAPLRSNWMKPQEGWPRAVLLRCHL